MTFDGFPRSALDFLTTLGSSDKTWFDANRKQYDAEVAAPAKAFVTDLGELLHDRISPGIEAVPKTNGSIAPINNDLRFSPDASPYKDHLMFRFWEGADKKTAPTLFVRMQPSGGVGFATGVALPDLEQWRTLIDDDETGAEGAARIAALAKATKADVVGEGYKRVPKPYAADHPRADLLRHKGLQIRWVVNVPRQITTARFVPWCADQLDKAADVHHWLVEHLSS